MKSSQVRICLVTLDGAKYLDQQLESIFNQVDIIPIVYALDLESQDETLKILNTWKKRGFNLEIYTHEKVHQVNAYLYLLNLIPNDLPVAFADQDDIWVNNKLKEQLDYLENKNGPTLVCTNRQYIDANNNFIKLDEKHLKCSKIGLSNALVENLVFGNTIIVNPAGLKLIKSSSFKNAVMHDMYIYLLFSCFGTIIYLEKKLTRYRLHETNSVGLHKRKFSQIRLNQKKYFIQAASFFSEHQSNLIDHQRLIFIRFLKATKSPLNPFRMYWVIFSPSRRSRIIDQFFWILILLTNRVS